MRVHLQGLAVVGAHPRLAAERVGPAVDEVLDDLIAGALAGDGVTIHGDDAELRRAI